MSDCACLCWEHIVEKSCMHIWCLHRTNAKIALSLVEHLTNCIILHSWYALIARPSHVVFFLSTLFLLYIHNTTSLNMDFGSYYFGYYLGSWNLIQLIPLLIIKGGKNVKSNQLHLNGLCYLSIPLRNVTWHCHPRVWDKPSTGSPGSQYQYNGMSC